MVDVEIKDIKLEDLLESGAHFGHRTSSMHPKMGEYVFGQRNGVHILDLAKTRQRLEEALNFVKEIASKGGVIIFVGTKPQASSIIEKCALEAQMPYVHLRWIGGTLTNFKVVSDMIKKFKKLKQDMEKGELEKYTKKEQLEFSREIKRLEELVGGLERLEKLPDALFIVDVREENIAVREARRLNIPVLAIVDTNSSPDGVTFPIPANDDGTKSIEFLVRLVKDAIIEGRELIGHLPPDGADLESKEKGE